METAALEPRPKSPALQRADAYVATLAHSKALEAAVARAAALTEIVGALGAEDEVVLGTLLYPLLDAAVISEEQAFEAFAMKRCAC